MKLSFIRRFLFGAGLAVGIGFFAACTKQDQQRVSDAATRAYEDTKAAAARTWDSIKANTWDKRDDFTAKAKAMTAKMDEQVRALQAERSDAKASASRKAAMEELRNSEADYHRKLEALGTATADTWESAKQNVILAWDKLQAAYYKARTD
jgi:hypothetical protein